MNIVNRIIRLEKDLNVNEQDALYILGDPRSPLNGEEAGAYIEKEQAAGRLLNPTMIDGSNVYQKYILYLPAELEG